MDEVFEELIFEECILPITIGKKHQVLSSDILKSGLYPVIDQGQKYITGFVNDNSKLFKPTQPVVIFGDHTRSIKYVDFPFIVGADGTKVIFPNTKLFNPLFFKYCLQSFDIPNRGYNRHYSLLKDFKIKKPSIEIQNKIVYILLTLQTAIEKQQLIIDNTQSLLKSLLDHFLTLGTKGERLKQTEIGMIPESWTVKEIGEIFKFSSGKSRPKKTGKTRTKNNPIPIYGGNGILGYTSELLFQEPKLILGRVGEYCGCSHITEDNSWISDNALYAKEILEDVNLKFFKYFFDHFDLNRFSNKNGQPLITQGGIKSLQFGMPEKKEQIIISNALDSINKKIMYHKDKKQCYNSLFKSLLNELISGSKNVNKIEFKPLSKLETV